MSRIHHMYSLTLALVFLSPVVSLGQTQPSVIPVQWDTLRTAAQDLKQNLVSGYAGPAHMRVIQMELLLAGAPQGLKAGDQVAEMEKRPVPEDHDASLSRFVPMADDLLQAIGEGDTTAVSSYLRQLNSNIGAERMEHGRQVKASLKRAGKDSAILNLQENLEHSLHANDVPRSVVLATEMQSMISDLVAKHEFVNNYALNHYLVNDALGRAAFLSGDYQQAIDYLQKAAETPLGARGTIDLDYLVQIFGWRNNSCVWGRAMLS